MDQLPDQYELYTQEQQLAKFENCKVKISTHPGAYLYSVYLNPVKRLVSKGQLIFFNFDLVERIKGCRPYLQFQLACYHYNGEKVLYYPINASFYVYDDDFVPIITLNPNREYVLNNNVTGYIIKEDNTVETPLMQSWRAPPSDDGDNSNDHGIKELFHNLTKLFSECSPYMRIHDIPINPDEVQILNSKLGEGQFGKTYLGKYQGKEVAVKLVKYDATSNSQNREQNISTKVKNRNIIITYGCYRTTKLPRFLPFKDEQLVFVMERADHDLKHYLQNTEMTYQARKHLIVEIASGLVYLYGYRITLHDIKPDNILMIGDVPKICDFGLASEYGGGNMITMSTIGVGNLMHLSYDNRIYAMAKKGTTFSYMQRDNSYYSEKVKEEIQQKEDVYGLGILIMDILLGYNYMYYYIDEIYKKNHSKEDFVVTIPKELTHDPVISSIVEDCLRPYTTRPLILSIIERLKEWEKTPTPENQEVLFEF